MMALRKRGRIGVGLLTLVVLSSACTSSTDADTTTSSAPKTLTTLSTTETPEGVTSTTTTEQPKTNLSAPEYSIVQRIDGGDLGDTVVVLLDPSTYNSLTDIDLYDLMAEVVERFPPIASIHIVDSAAAAAVVANPDASEADRNATAANYLAKLDDGFRITYLGPFASSGTAVLGS